DDPEVDGVIVIFIPTGAADIDAVAEGIRQGRREAESKASKPLVASFMSQRGMTTPLATEEEAIPSYRFPESAARAVAKAAEHGAWLARPQGVIPAHPDIDVEAAREICERALEERGDGWLLPTEVEGVLRAFGIPSVRTVFCRTADEAAAAAARTFDGPVVVKLASKTLVHMTEWDGVHLALRGDESVRRAYGAT